MISFKSIVESGLRKPDTYQTKRGIVLSNYIALILCFSLVTLFTIRLLFFNNIDRNTIIDFSVGIVFFMVTIFLNRLYLTTLSRLYLCVFPVCFLWYVFINNMKSMPVIPPTDYDSLRVFLLALSCIPYLLLDKKKMPVFILGILPAFVSIFFLGYLLKIAGVDPMQNGAPGNDYAFIQLRTIVSFLMISSCCVAFQLIIINNDEFNQRLVTKLKEKTNEIENQHEELIQSHSSLNEINQHLESMVEERTREIMKQNEILLKYTYTNAHHVRGPVARVLGLIELSRMKTDLDYAWFFEKVEHEAKAIDQIIKQIGSELQPAS